MPKFDGWFVLSVFGICITSFQMAPQVIKSLRSGKTEDVSIGLGLIVGLSSITWIILGMHSNDTPLVIANIINLICSAILVSLKIREFVRKSPASHRD